MSSGFDFTRLAEHTQPMKRLYCMVLLDLCESHDLNSITVSQVVRAAGTARQTFYNHFRDMRDLVAYLPVSYLLGASRSPHDMEGTRTAYTYALAHKSFFRQLPHHEGRNNFRESFITAMENVFYDYYLTPNLSEHERLYRLMSIDEYVSGVTDLFLEWCAAGLEWPIDLMLRVHEEATPSFIRNHP